MFLEPIPSKNLNLYRVRFHFPAESEMFFNILLSSKEMFEDFKIASPEYNERMLNYIDNMQQRFDTKNDCTYIFEDELMFLFSTLYSSAFVYRRCVVEMNKALTQSLKKNTHEHEKESKSSQNNKNAKN